jgi:1-acyl-sn-glycerol-3-phosphate acyltransferase
MAKVYLFVTAICIVSQIGSLILLPWYLLGMNVERMATMYVERWAALLVVSILIGPVTIVGAEHLPPPSDSRQGKNPQGFVYIANHSSQIDGAAVYFMNRRFRLILKQSIIFLPGLGLLTVMARHIFIDRDKTKNKTNVQAMYDECYKTLQTGKSIFIFPQGTRRMDRRLPFKDGAFNIAIQSEAPIVPVSINIPNRAWNSAYPLNRIWNRRKKMEPIILTIHKPIMVTKDSGKEALKESCFHAIYNALPEYDIIDSAFKKKY